MRVPVYFRQCGSLQEARLFIQEIKAKWGCQAPMVLWEGYLLVGLVGDFVRVRPGDGFDTKIAFYDEKEKDYEPGVWNDKVKLFADIKADVMQMSCDEVASEYFKGRGIEDARNELMRRIKSTSWDMPAFFKENDIASFECMFDCENYMRAVIISERIFKALDADNRIFEKKERKSA